MERQESLLQLNARMMKWRQMIKNDTVSDYSLLKNRVRKGIPRGMRIVVWPYIVKTDRYNLKSCDRDFKTSATLFLNNQQAIRQFILKNKQGQQIWQSGILDGSRFKLIKSLLVLFPQLQYSIALDTLITKLLIILDDENCFNVIYFIIKNNSPYFNCLRNEFYCQQMRYCLTRLLQNADSQLYQKWKNLNCFGSIAPNQWFISLFSVILPEQIFYRVLECLMLEGYKIIYRCLITIIKFIVQSSKKDVEQKETIQCLKAIQAKNFMNEMFRVKFSRTQIREYEIEYSKTKRNIREKVQNQVKMRTSKKIYQSRIKEDIIVQQKINIQTVNTFQNKKTYEFEDASLQQ